MTSYFLSYFRAGFYAIMAHCYASLCTLHCANLCGRTTQSFPSKLIPPIKNQSAVFPTFLDQSKGSQKDSQTLSTNPSSKVPPKCPPPLSATCRDVVKIKPFSNWHLNIFFLSAQTAQTAGRLLNEIGLKSTDHNSCSWLFL